MFVFEFNSFEFDELKTIRIVLSQWYAVSLIIRSRSSGCVFASWAALLRTTVPHFSHLWMMIYPRFESGSAPAGRRIPPQLFALSPGFISTWSEHRQNGQWLREVYPRGKTSLPQFLHMNPLSFFENLLLSIKTSTFQRRTLRIYLQPPLPKRLCRLFPI